MSALPAAARAPSCDGYYVQFWRLLLRYPELAAWEMLWTDSLRETYAAIYKTVKTAKPAVPVGWHIWHNNSFNPIYRAEQDLHELSNYSDFIKVVMYNNCGGERMALYADNIGQTLYGDLSKQSLLDMNYAQMGFKEKSYDQIPHSGLSAGLRLSRNQALSWTVSQARTRWIWPRHRYRYPDRTKEQQEHTPEREGSSIGGLPRRRAGRNPIPQIFRDAPRQPQRGGRCDSGVEAIEGRLSSQNSRHEVVVKTHSLESGAGFPLMKSSARALLVFTKAGQPCSLTGSFTDRS